MLTVIFYCLFTFHVYFKVNFLYQYSLSVCQDRSMPLDDREVIPAYKGTSGYVGPQVGTRNTHGWVVGQESSEYGLSKEPGFHFSILSLKPGSCEDSPPGSAWL